MSVYAKLAAARSIVKPVVKTETVDTGKYEYTYSTLGSVMAAVDAACETVRLTWWQETFHLSDLNWQMITVLYDAESDEHARFGGAINTTKADPQANGSATTYARRYSLVLLFGLNQHDDDGAQAHRAVAQPTQRTPAEVEVRQIVAALPDAMAREDFQSAFVATFGCTLTNLPESRHGDALTFAKGYRPLTESIQPTQGALPT